jgi:hypothetical protein
MPYIDFDDRERLDKGGQPTSVGELNYAITRLVVAYLGHEPGYRQINAAIGVLECAKLELYRRVAAPYETAKCEGNGDVYE